MICGQPNGCGRDLPPGAAHINLESCIQFLKACVVCHEEVPVTIHPGCVPAELGRRGSKIAADKATQKLQQGFVDWLTGGQKPSNDEGEDPPRRKRSGGRFEP